MNIFKNYIPYKIFNQTNNEYEYRLNEIKYCLGRNYDIFKRINDEIDTIKILLELSIFYKRIILSLDDGAKFSIKIFKNSNATSIKLGAYELSNNELCNINIAILQFKKLLNKFSIPIYVFDYLDTYDFLLKLVYYKKSLIEESSDGEPI